MTLYFVTARTQANPHRYLTWKKEPVSFPTRGWEAFAAFVTAVQPEVVALLARLSRPASEYPRHPTYEVEGEPLPLVWTEAECRQLFLALSQASRQAQETAYDFWEFLALICCGVNEEGICVY